MDINLIEVEVKQLIEGTTKGTNQKVLGLVLTEKNGPRMFMIEIEPSDALVLTTLTKNGKPSSPPLPWVVADILRILDTGIICVAIAKTKETKEKVLQAVVKLNGKDSIPIRPPDAIALAMITNAQIFVAEELLIDPANEGRAKPETRKEKKAREETAAKNAKENEMLKAEIERLDRTIDQALEAQDFSKVAELQKEAHMKRLLLGDILKPPPPGLFPLLDEYEHADDRLL